jgi:hypothetical protein
MIQGGSELVFQNKLQGMLKDGGIVIIQPKEEAANSIDSSMLNLANGGLVVFGLAPCFIDVPEILLGKALKADKSVSNIERQGTSVRLEQSEPRFDVAKCQARNIAYNVGTVS